jgi:hypothetical protein
MSELLPCFCVFHVNAPGQEEGAAKLPDDFVYPSMDELAEQVGPHQGGQMSLGKIAQNYAQHILVNTNWYKNFTMEKGVRYFCNFFKKSQNKKLADMRKFA